MLKASRQFYNHPDSFETVQTILKQSRQCQGSSDNNKAVQRVLRLIIIILHTWMNCIHLVWMLFTLTRQIGFLKTIISFIRTKTFRTGKNFPDNNANLEEFLDPVIKPCVNFQLHNSTLLPGIKRCAYRILKTGSAYRLLTLGSGNRDWSFPWNDYKPLYSFYFNAFQGS